MWDNSSKSIRPGNRGGRDQFKWEDLRKIAYRDREMYLGYTTKLGYLDKGGKWRRKNWWINDTKIKSKTINNLAMEMKVV